MAKQIATTLFLMVAYFLYQHAGLIEGRIAPVMGRLVLEESRPYDGGAASVWAANAQKHRNCSFIRVEWFVGERSGPFVPVGTSFLDAPEVRRPGELSWTGLVVDATVRQVLEHSFADVLHQCPNRPWLTRTRFFDSPAAEGAHE